jgi:hypothetical protein
MPRRLRLIVLGLTLAIVAVSARATDAAPVPGASAALVRDLAPLDGSPTAVDPSPAGEAAAPPPADATPADGVGSPNGPTPPAGAPAVARGMRDEAIAATLGALVEQSWRLVRAYAQAGLQVRPDVAHAALADAARAGDRLLDTLSWGAARRLGPDAMRDLSLRWRALRDAAGTRPQPSIAVPLDAVAGQLAATAARAAERLPAAPRSLRQRTLLQRIAAAHALGCWGAAATPPERMLAMRAEFGHGLADALDDAGLEGGLAAATLRSQWGLLTASLDAGDAGCEPAGVLRVATTTDRLLQHFDRGAHGSGERARR